LFQVKNCFYIIIRNYGIITLIENDWNTENVDSEIITMEELKRALRKNMENHLAKVT
jgi:hypothetical protein